MAEAADADALMREFMKEVKETDRENEVARILNVFKPNPYEYLGVKFDAADEEIRRAFRKSSLLIHPDKCKHEHASAAFDALGAAYKVLTDEQKKAGVDAVLTYAKELVAKDWNKAQVKDGAQRMKAAVASQRGQEYDFTKEDEFHQAWRDKAREVMAQAEWRKRKQQLRLKDEEGRQRELDESEQDAKKRKRDAVAQWEKERESRINSWRGFQKSKSGGAAAPPSSRQPQPAGAGAGGPPRRTGAAGAMPRRVGAFGGIKPPKVQTRDDKGRRM